MANVSSFSGAMPVIPGGLVEAAEVTRTTSLTAVAGTTFSGGTEIFSSDLTFVADGGPYLVEFFTPQIIHNSTNHTSFFGLSDGGTTQIGMLGSISLQSSYNSFVRLQGKYTPAAGAVTLNVRCWVDSGNTDIGAGAGTSTNLWPAFLRVSKIVNQNDGLKPFWTPPVVTSLPSQATEGDQVLLYSSSPYAGYQTHQYVTGSWRTLGDSRINTAWQSYTPTLSGGTWAAGNGTFSAQYAKIGKLAFCRGQFTVGSTTVKASGNALAISLPTDVPAATANATLGVAGYLDSGVDWFIGQCELASTTTIQFNAPLVSGSSLLYRGVTSTTPFTWATNDLIRWSITYEAA